MISSSCHLREAAANHPPQLVNYLKKRPPNVNENGMLFNQWFYGTEGGFAGVSKERDNTKVKPRICLLRLTSFIILLATCPNTLITLLPVLNWRLPTIAAAREEDADMYSSTRRERSSYATRHETKLTRWHHLRGEDFQRQTDKSDCDKKILTFYWNRLRMIRSHHQCSAVWTDWESIMSLQIKLTGTVIKHTSGWRPPPRLF